MTEGPRHSHFRWRSAAAALLAPWGLAGAAPAQDAPPVSRLPLPGEATQPAETPPHRGLNGLAAALPEESRALLRRLSDPAATKELRDEAAMRLVSATDPAVLNAVAALIDAGDADRSTSDALLGAISRKATPAAELYPAVARAAASASADRAVAPIVALGSFRTPEAVRALLAFTSPDRPAPVRAAAFRALGRLTGRDDLADDHERWTAWFQGVETLDRAEWNAVIVAGLARRNDRLDAALGETSSRLADAFRRLYLAVSGATAEDRPRLLAGLLADDREELRNLGFELVARELSSGSSVDPSIGAAAIRLLGHGSAAVRTRAASLVNQMAPTGAGAAVAAAIEAETDPGAAGALLLAAARWPSETVLPHALRWLAGGGEARASAVQTLLALHRAGLLLAEGDREAVRTAYRSADPMQLTAAEIRLLGAVGGEEERRRLVACLASDVAPRRLAAAEALSPHPQFVDDLLRAAGLDAGLFDAAVQAVRNHRHSAAGMRDLMVLPTASPEARRSGLLRAAEGLPLADLMETARRVEDKSLCEALLAPLVASAQKPDAQGADAVFAGLVLLAECRLAMGRPDAALPALAAAAGAADPGTAARVEHLRTVALLWTGRLEDAQALDGPVEAWLEGLEHAISQPHAGRIVTLARARFAQALNPDQQARLLTLEARAADEAARQDLIFGPPPPPDR